LWQKGDREVLVNQIQHLKSEVIGEAAPSVVAQVIQEESEDDVQTIVGVTGTVKISIPLAGLVDFEAMKAKIERDLKKVEAEIQALTGRLSNPKFVDKAPPEVVQTNRDNLAEFEKQAEILRSKLDKL
jgi:valyl-tRNA synthetase